VVTGTPRDFRTFCLGGFDELQPFHSMTDAQITEYQDGMVAAVKATRALIVARCSLSTELTDDIEVTGNGPQRVVGLSPNNRLVGAMNVMNNCW